MDTNTKYAKKNRSDERFFQISQIFTFIQNEDVISSESVS